MRKIYGIGFLIVISMLLTAGIYVLDMKSKSNLKNNEEFDYRIAEDAEFLLKDNEGYVTVYKKEGGIYDYTSIKTSDLPRDLQNDLNSGIHIENVEELYGFLENYSS